MWMHYPTDRNVFAMDDQFLVGKDLLVKVRDDCWCVTVLPACATMGFVVVWVRVPVRRTLSEGGGTRSNAGPNHPTTPTRKATRNGLDDTSTPHH